MFPSGQHQQIKAPLQGVCRQVSSVLNLNCQPCLMVKKCNNCQGSSNQKFIGQAAENWEQQIDTQRSMCMCIIIMYFIEIILIITIIVDIDHLKIYQIFLIYVQSLQQNHYPHILSPSSLQGPCVHVRASDYSSFVGSWCCVSKSSLA